MNVEAFIIGLLLMFIGVPVLGGLIMGALAVSLRLALSRSDEPEPIDDTP